ncbi:MAG: S8 family peptidase, partial [Flavobacteriales bacterium]|nr:S8 family peptidase [Flavobacteriales bacterium]
YWMESRDGQYLLQAYMQEPDSAQYHFRFETTGTGSFDVWTTSVFGTSNMENRADTIVGFTEVHKYVYPDTLQTIVSSFQCSPNVVTVGNYANDSGYVNNLGGWTPAPGETRGKLAATSSKGPTRTGLIKPELAASGAVTNSAFPLTGIDYFVTNGLDSLLAIGGMHYRNGGTSMSSPVVAGVAALFLEQCPKADPSYFSDALINAAYADSFTGVVPNNAFGYGKLDGFETLINAKEFATFSGNNLICEGDSNQFSITSTNVSYLWESGDTASFQYFSDSIDTYFIVTNLTTGCISDTMTISTSVAEKPTLECLTNTYDFCENTSITITESGVFNSVYWNDGLTLNPRVFTQDYDGYILGLDTNSCLSDTCFITVTEQPNPAQATITNNNAILSTSSGYESYQWYLDGSILAGANDSVYTAMQNGNYQVEVFNSYGCSTFSSITTISSVDIIEHTISGTIYPNPNNGTFTIETNKYEVTLRLYSSLGKLISTTPLSDSTTHKYQNLSAGAYFILLSDDLQVVCKKIVVLK